MLCFKLIYLIKSNQNKHILYIIFVVSYHNITRSDQIITSHLITSWSESDSDSGWSGFHNLLNTCNAAAVNQHWRCDDAHCYLHRVNLNLSLSLGYHQIKSERLKMQFTFGSDSWAEYATTSTLDFQGPHHCGKPRWFASRASCSISKPHHRWWSQNLKLWSRHLELVIEI